MDRSYTLCYNLLSYVYKHVRVRIAYTYLQIIEYSAGGPCTKEPKKFSVNFFIYKSKSINLYIAQDNSKEHSLTLKTIPIVEKLNKDCNTWSACMHPMNTVLSQCVMVYFLVEKDKKWFCTDLRKNTEFRWAPSEIFTRPQLHHQTTGDLRILIIIFIFAYVCNRQKARHQDVLLFKLYQIISSQVFSLTLP